MKNVRPILFNQSMVPAIQSDRKTQTRRVVNDPLLQNVTLEFYDEEFLLLTMKKCTYGEVGDGLWVKETFFAYGKWIKNGTSKSGKEKFRFLDMTLSRGHKYMYLDNPPNKVCSGALAKSDEIVGWFKRPALFMPFLASRILLQIINTRVERLMEISNSDAIAEGIYGRKLNPCEICDLQDYGMQWMDYGAGGVTHITPAESFRSLWQFINGSGSWNENPYVWVIEFKRIEKL